MGGLEQTGLDAFDKSDLWAGWPTAFLTFGTPAERPNHHFDPDFVRVRACLVASSVCASKGAKPRWYDWADVPWTEIEEEVEQLKLDYKCDLWKSRNRKWKDHVTTKRRVRRVPWATTNGSAVSRSSRLARRLPKCRRHLWARERKGV